MRPKQYIWIVALGFIVLLSAIFTFDCLYDPQKKISYITGDYDKNYAEYVHRLLDSRYGMYYEKQNTELRLIKREIAIQAKDIDCAIVGASNVFQLSDRPGIAALQSICAGVTNLSVIGGSFEDMLAISHLLYLRKKMPKKIIFAVHPWLLTSDNNNEWRCYASDVYAMKYGIHTEQSIGIHISALRASLLHPEEFKMYYALYLKPVRDFISSMIDLTAFRRSVIYFVTGSGRPELNEVLTPVASYDKVILRPDGSGIYPETYHAQKKVLKIYGQDYRRSSHLQNDAIITFKHLLMQFKAKNTEVVILMTPYNPIVKRSGFTEKMERLMHDLGSELDVAVIGSFNPELVGCGEHEFDDDVHPQISCLIKLDKIKTEGGFNKRQYR